MLNRMATAQFTWKMWQWFSKAGWILPQGEQYILHEAGERNVESCFFKYG